MRRFWLIGLATPALAMIGASGAGAGRFSGNVCRIPSAGELTAAHISGPCKKQPARTETSHTKVGTLTRTKYTAHWGFLPTSGAGHVLTIGITKVGGDPALLAAGRAKLRSRILGEGVPVGIGSVSEWHGVTASCPNPPSEDCTTDNVTAVVGNYIIGVVLIDVPIGAPAPEGEEADNAADLEQEEADKPAIVAIAKAVAKAL